jgi:peptidoglycan/LPS O-acetylase OafA/YrhL
MGGGLSGSPRLRRITTSGRFLPEVDGLRFVAIVLVVLYHLDLTVRGNAPSPLQHAWGRTWTSQLAQQGHFGVQFFFVLSGFILGLPFALHALLDAPAVRIRPYLLRRLTRLEPPYMIALVIKAAALLAAGRMARAVLVPHLLASMLYLHNAVYGSMSTISVVAWSLEIEIQFYLLAPLLSAVFLIRNTAARRAVLLGGMGAAALAQLLWMHPDTRAGLSLLYFVQFFLAGFLLVDLYITDWRQAPTPHALGDVVGSVALAGALAVGYEQWLPGLLLPLLVLLFYGGVFRGRLLRRALCWAPVVTIGGMCYTIYLWHYSIIAAVERGTGALSFPGSYPLTLAIQFVPAALVVLGVATALFIGLERPCMQRDWPRRLLEKVGVMERGRRPQIVGYGRTVEGGE